MTSFGSLVLLTLFSTQALGQNTDSLIENRWVEQQLGIGALETSDKEIDLRIFLGRGITNGGFVIRIVKSSAGWAGTKYDYVMKIENGELKKQMTKTIETELKSNNWDALWNKLESLDIASLPNQTDIRDKLRTEVITKRGKGYNELHVLDGDGYDLTIKKGQVLSSYSFHSPCTYSQRYPDVEEVRKYCEIISTLENEFQIKFRW